MLADECLRRPEESIRAILAWQLKTLNPLSIFLIAIFFLFIIVVDQESALYAEEQGGTKRDVRFRSQRSLRS